MEFPTETPYAAPKQGAPCADPTVTAEVIKRVTGIELSRTMPLNMFLKTPIGVLALLKSQALSGDEKKLAGQLIIRQFDQPTIDKMRNHLQSPSRVLKNKTCATSTFLDTFTHLNLKEFNYKTLGMVVYQLCSLRTVVQTPVNIAEIKAIFAKDQTISDLLGEASKLNPGYVEWCEFVAMTSLLVNFPVKLLTTPTAMVEQKLCNILADPGKFSQDFSQAQKFVHQAEEATVPISFEEDDSFLDFLDDLDDFQKDPSPLVNLIVLLKVGQLPVFLYEPLKSLQEALKKKAALDQVREEVEQRERTADLIMTMHMVLDRTMCSSCAEALNIMKKMRETVAKTREAGQLDRAWAYGLFQSDWSLDRLKKYLSHLVMVIGYLLDDFPNNNERFHSRNLFLKAGDEPELQWCANKNQLDQIWPHLNTTSIKELRDDLKTEFDTLGSCISGSAPSGCRRLLTLCAGRRRTRIPRSRLKHSSILSW